MSRPQARPHARPAIAAFGVALSLAGGAATGLSGGCYSEREPPPTYRYACGGDGDCDDTEQCRSGLCERPCSFATFEDDCGDSGTFVACFNGACSSTCEVGAGACLSSQECVDLAALGVDLSGLAGGGAFGGGNAPELGICGRMCDGDNDLCPSDETCIEGFCTGTCDPMEPDSCAEGLVCFPPGICVPGTSGGDMGSGDMGLGSGDMDSGDMGSGGSTTGGAG